MDLPDNCHLQNSSNPMPLIRQNIASELVHLSDGYLFLYLKTACCYSEELMYEQFGLKTKIKIDVCSPVDDEMGIKLKGFCLPGGS